MDWIFSGSILGAGSPPGGLAGCFDLFISPACGAIFINAAGCSTVTYLALVGGWMVQVGICVLSIYELIFGDRFSDIAKKLSELHTYTENI